ncbi:MAG TPA: oligosaccharide flippase family protein, partial [bacterium]
PGLLFTVFYTKKRMTLVWKPHKGEMTSLLRKASPLFVYLLLAMLYERLDVFFLKSFWGDSQVGLYSSAFRMTAPLAFIPYAIATALYPLFSKNSAEQERISDRFFGFGLKALLVIGAAIGSAGILFGKSFFGIYGSLYAEAATPFQVLLWGQAVSFLTFFLVDFNNSQNRQLHNTVYMAVMVFFAFWVQRYLILRLGVLGASWAKIILNATGLAVLSAMAWNHLSLQQRRHVYTTAWILGLFLMAACGSFLRSVPFWMKGVTFGAAIAVCIRWLFSKEEKQLLRKMVQQYQTQSGTAT